MHMYVVVYGNLTNKFKLCILENNTNLYKSHRISQIWFEMQDELN